MLDNILYGVAYYDEYMPEDRLELDMQMMRKAGINAIRIAESTWATEEPREGEFDFFHVTRTIEMAAKYDISVIVGTPTYAIPPWLYYKCPEVIATTEKGTGKYGARQNMDITHPVYRQYAERVIRKLMEAVASYPNVIGFQLDNETKHYHTAGAGVQKRFVSYLQEKFDTVEALNKEFGFAYWSNAIDSFDHVPDVTGTINGSFLAEFEKFRRTLVDEFLMWQRQIVDAYRRTDQFVTHNFDFEWRGYSFGVQPDVNHFHAAEAVTLAGCDIYHETQDSLSGKEAAFCGAMTRALKKDNYLVLETQAQGHIGWTPYDGQLRMQAFSHLANGADGVMYWHWHSIHNSFETYWRGLLGHDLQENRLYREAMTIGADFERLQKHLLHLKKENKVAILVSNESLTALSQLPLFPLPDASVTYNDVIRQYADALYELNVEYDVVSDDTRLFAEYELVIVPVLYSAADSLLEALSDYVKQGGHLVVTFKSAYANEYLTVSHDRKPHILHECLGVSYQEYTIPRKVGLKKYFEEKQKTKDAEALVWMELLEPEQDTRILADYVHPQWKQYAAVTEHTYGTGTGIYIGCHTDYGFTKDILAYAVRQAGLELVEPALQFPVNSRHGINSLGKKVHYFFHYAEGEVCVTNPYGAAKELINQQEIAAGEQFILGAWDVKILEEK